MRNFVGKWGFMSDPFKKLVSFAAVSKSLCSLALFFVAERFLHPLLPDRVTARRKLFLAALPGWLVPLPASLSTHPGPNSSWHFFFKKKARRNTEVHLSAPVCAAWARDFSAFTTMGGCLKSPLLLSRGSNSQNEMVVRL